MSSSVTIMAIPALDPDAFEALSLDERRAGAWETFPLRSGRLLYTFFSKATKADLGVFGSEDIVRKGETIQTGVIFQGDHVAGVIKQLGALLRSKARTARALVAHGGGVADLARVTAALHTGTWPKGKDPAEEAAAFAHHLLKFARIAKQELRGVCWEYRGKVKA